MKKEPDITEWNKLLHEFLNLGELMLRAGAEIKRVEDTLIRMGTAYGAEKTNVFVITSSIIMTISFQEGKEVTQTRRIVNDAVTDFTMLEAINELSRSCCESPVSAEALKKRIELLNQNAPQVKNYIGSAIGAGCFSIFFGGNIYDGICAAIFGLLICFFKLRMKPLCPNNIIFNLLSSLLVGSGICLVAKLLPLLHLDMIMIGDIMLLIPGIAMTNSIRDLLVGDTISGVMRSIESILWAGALACGFMLAIHLI